MKKIVYGLLLSICLASCGSAGKLVTTHVAYQSVRSVAPKAEIPDNARIIVGYTFTDEGALVAVVKNNTDEVMIIDQTKSFVVNSDGTSISYYDPTVRMTSETTSTSTTKGGSLNLGAFAGALGVGGVLGTLANGVNVGGANTVGHSTTNATYFSDQPQISLAPKGNGVMSKEYLIGGLGTSFLSNPAERNSTYTPDNSYCKFRVCITYSIDNGQTFDKIVTDFYANSWIVSPVRVHGKVNDALHTILSGKPDAIHESWWLLYFKDNIDSYYDIKTKLYYDIKTKLSSRMVNGMITDYR